MTVVLEALVAFPVVVVVFFGARDARIAPLHAPPTRLNNVSLDDFTAQFGYCTSELYSE